MTGRLSRRPGRHERPQEGAGAPGYGGGTQWDTASTPTQKGSQWHSSLCWGTASIAPWASREKGRQDTWHCRA
eukprot:1495315-Heterocapsa_arctica.AAC.1